jgi:hypothetical protein
LLTGDYTQNLGFSGTRTTTTSAAIPEYQKITEEVGDHLEHRVKQSQPTSYIGHCLFAEVKTLAHLNFSAPIDTRSEQMYYPR